jgi:SAM-dependent methyltransferase
VSASKRKRDDRVQRSKPSSKRTRAKAAQVALRARTHAPSKPKQGARGRTAPKPRGAVAKTAAKPAKPAAKPPAHAAKPVSKPTAVAPRPAAPVAAPPSKKPKVIQPRQETPKDTPAPRPAAKTPAPKKPKPPAKTMQVPPPSTAPLLMLDMPDVRRATAPRPRGIDLSRGHLRPEPMSKSKDAPTEDGPVDASLIMSSLAIDAAPKIEDNYDYSLLDEFRSSKHCPSPTRVVNTGCGGGEAAVYFAKLSYKVVGIDSDRLAVGLARERAWLAGQDVDFMVGDLFETPNLLPAESFGLAIDRGAFYRLEDDRDRQRYLANIKRLLFQGGVLLLSAGFFPLDDKAVANGKRPPKGGTKLLLAREGGVVVNELRQAGFDLMHRILRKTADSGDYGELLLYLKK